MNTSSVDKISFNWKPLLDIGIAAVGTGAGIYALSLIPGIQQIPTLAVWVIPGVGTLAAWLVLRWRGMGFKDIGVRKPDSLGKTILIGLALALALYFISLGTEALGHARDMSRFDILKDNLPLALMGLLFGFFGAGFYEETFFRGFLGDRLATMLGGGKKQWVIAIILQAVLFGAAHFYQGVYGIFYTGLAGLLFGFIYLKCNRNLWPVIIGHGVYDSARFIYFYYMLTYGGLETLAH